MPSHSLIAPSIAPSRTKREFFTQLNLTKGHEADENIFRKLLGEAAAERQRLSERLENLRIQYRWDQIVHPPYSYNHFTETALHREILHICHIGAAELQPLYSQGWYCGNQKEDNWVVRWCLYHSFRYTDRRNRTLYRDLGSAPYITGEVENELHNGRQFLRILGEQSEIQQSSKAKDRSGRAHDNDESLDGQEELRATTAFVDHTTLVSRPQYWDPVRDM